MAAVRGPTVETQNIHRNVITPSPIADMIAPIPRSGELRLVRERVRMAVENSRERKSKRERERESKKILIGLNYRLATQPTATFEFRCWGCGTSRLRDGDPQVRLVWFFLFRGFHKWEP